MRNADEVLSSFNEYCDRHHVADQIDDAVHDDCSASFGEQFVTAFGVLMESAIALHESGELADEWPELSALLDSFG